MSDGGNFRSDVPWRHQFDNARDPYTARNALGITALGGGAPVGAQYITAAADATLTNERVLTNTATVTWDFTTPGQAKASTAGGGGNVSNSGTPTLGQYAKWVTATTIQGVAPATVLSDIGAQPAGSYQPLDADLTAIAGLASAADQVPYFTGSGTAALMTVTSAARTVLDDTSVANMLTTLGGQPLDGDLTSLAAAAGTNTIYYRSAANTWSPVVVSTGLAFSGGNLTATGAGGNVSNSGTPAAGQVAEWVTATTIAGVSTYAKLASPVFTGDPQAPTPATADNDTSIATTAFVKNAIAKSSFRARLSADEGGIAAASFTVVTFNTIVSDIGSHYSTGGLFWQPPAGLAMLNMQLNVSNVVAGNAAYLFLYKNGTAIRSSGTIGGGYISLTVLENANGSDYYQVYIWVQAVSGAAVIASGMEGTFFEGIQLT